MTYKKSYMSLSIACASVALMQPLFISSASAAFDASTCSQSSIRCVGDGMEYDTNIANQEVAFQNAVDAAQPGDTVVIRGGRYLHNRSTSSTDTFLVVQSSGTSGSPIVIKGAEGEDAIIEGFGFAETSSAPTRGNEILVDLRGAYVHLKNLTIEYSSRYGVAINGSNNLIENAIVSDSWYENISIGNDGTTVSNNVIRYVETFRSRHGSGILINRGSRDTNQVGNNVVEYSLSYDNGFEPDGDKVPAIDGDPAGGGNSDGFGVTKNCNDNAPANSNICPNNIYRYNIAWHNADDGYDVSFGGGSKLIGNISFNNGPEGNKGFKVLRNVSGGLSYIGNVSLNGFSRGIETRFNDEGNVLHNVVMGEPSNSFYVNASVPSGTQFINNLAYDNSSGLMATSGITKSNNSIEDGSAPAMRDPTLRRESIDTAPSGVSEISSKHEAIYRQVKDAFTPTANSGLIDAGLFVAGIHCARADDDADNPYNPSDESCRHWVGAAPDIGAYEYGIDRIGPSAQSPPAPPPAVNARSL